MMKKFISVVICALMLLALGAPAFASYESESFKFCYAGKK